MQTQSQPKTRRLLPAFAALLAVLALSGCFGKQKWHATDIKGVLPALAFSMTSARHAKTVTAADYRGKVVVLAFGYTNCPDICPTTLANLTEVLGRLHDKAGGVQILFVTVDPNRDTLTPLKAYVEAFAPQIDGLRGTPGALAALAKRYRIAYSVSGKTAIRPYEVSHGSAVYVFGRSGAARLLETSLFTAKPDLKGLTSDLRRLLRENPKTGFLSRLFG